VSTEWPTFGLASDVRPLLARALAAGEPAVLVTLVRAEGAAPLGVGSQMLFTPSARSGFLSGGCVEGDVALHAAEVLADGAPRRLVYGRGGPPDIRLLCGARIELLVERMAPEEAARLIELAERRRPALWLSDGATQRVVEEGVGHAPLAATLSPGEAEAGRSASMAAWAGQAMFRRFDPRPRLAIVGGDPIALATARLAVDAELEVALIRPKGPVEPPPAPGVRYLRERPAEALSRLGLDPWTAVAALSHDLEADHEALVASLGSPACYVGVLGSRRRIAERHARLREAGVGEAELKRLKAPIGLDIGARSPYEIAVSIVAEVVSAFRGQDARRTWRIAASATP
jgi:xanthine dehydrogenase accessory factor